MKRLVILGAGGYGSVVADVARQLDYEIIQLDDGAVALTTNKTAPNAKETGWQ